MPEFTAQCSNCGFTFSADESHIGLTTSCANCSQEFVIKCDDESIPGGPTSSTPSRQHPTPPSRPDSIIVTSGDLSVPYEIVGMVCFTVGTRGELRNAFESLKAVMAHKLSKAKGQISKGLSAGQFIGGVGVDSAGDVAFSGQYAGATFNSKDLEIAFHMAVGQLQLRASYLHANAVIAFRYDVDFDSNANVLNFMATGYGTAVKVADR